jgi:hypothetical protein
VEKECKGLVREKELVEEGDEKKHRFTAKPPSPPKKPYYNLCVVIIA